MLGIVLVWLLGGWMVRWGEVGLSEVKAIIAFTKVEVEVEAELRSAKLSSA